MRILLGSGPAPSREPIQRLDLGPEHPTRAGHLEIVVESENGFIHRVQAIPGAMHRGVEKLFEVRDYRQVLSLADRHDWQAPFFGELAAATAIENALGIEIPPRAVWLRTLFSEHFRLHSHLAFLGWVWHSLAPDESRIQELRVLREQLRELTRDLTGNRVHPMVNRIGGLAATATASWLESEIDLAARIGQLSAPLEAALTGAPAGIAPIYAEVIEQYGLSGPTARAAGFDWDLRTGTLSYAATGVSLGAGVSSSDAAGRLLVMARELASSSAIIAACAQELANLPGPVAVELPKILRVPEGDWLVEVESPLGRAGVFLVARGEKTPWRLKLRTPSFANVSALEAVLPGVALEHLEFALASIGYVTGDLDK